MKKIASLLIFIGAMLISVCGSTSVFADTEAKASANTNATTEQQAQDTQVKVNKKEFVPGVVNEVIIDKFKTLKVDIDFDADRIKSIKLQNPEVLKKIYPGLLESFNDVSENIVKENSPHVDSVTGATVLSNDLKKAVYNAMQKASKTGTNPQDKSADVVVIGSGGAGLAAAIQAHDDGAKVIIVEKMPVIGGNTTKSSAGLNAAETKFQKAQGIVDKKEDFYNETLKGGKNTNNPELLRYFADHANEAVDWLDNNGIELSNITITGGMETKRTHRPASGESVGGFLINGLVKNINKRGIDVLLETAAVDIETNKDGVVTGVKVLDEQTKQEYVVKAKAVVVATGGFSANSKMVVKYRPELKGFVTTNHAGAIGTGIKMLEKLGADTVDMDKIQIHPSVEQKTSYLISESIRGGGAILVSQAGKRFFNELETRDKVSAAIINLPEKYTYILFDQQVADENLAVKEYIRKQLVVKGETIQELAEKLKINPATLEETINKYNGFAEKKQDDDFKRNPASMPHPLNKAPYYAVKIAPGVHHTMGGVTINTNTEVLNKDKQVIKGVYAAGEVAGGIHGANRIGGNAVADIIVFGIQAGKKSAEYAKEHSCTCNK